MLVPKGLSAGPFQQCPTEVYICCLLWLSFALPEATVQFFQATRVSYCLGLSLSPSASTHIVW